MRRGPDPPGSPPVAGDTRTCHTEQDIRQHTGWRLARLPARTPRLRLRTTTVTKTWFKVPKKEEGRRRFKKLNRRWGEFRKFPLCTQRCETRELSGAEGGVRSAREAFNTNSAAQPITRLYVSAGSASERRVAFQTLTTSPGIGGSAWRTERKSCAALCVAGASPKGASGDMVREEEQGKGQRGQGQLQKLSWQTTT